MKTRWTLQEWLDGRLSRRQISDLISPGDCGRTTSKNDKALREAFGGRRNLPFALTSALAKTNQTEKPLRQDLQDSEVRK